MAAATRARGGEAAHTRQTGVNFVFTALGSAGIAITFNTWNVDAERRSLVIDPREERKATLSDLVGDARRVRELLHLLLPPT